MSLPKLKMINGVIRIMNTSPGKICKSSSKQKILDMFAAYGLEVPTPQPSKSVLCDILNSRTERAEEPEVAMHKQGLIINDFEEEVDRLNDEIDNLKKIIKQLRKR
jgi:polyhydroxyalkanoate synthesis regulator phasin